MTISVLFNTVKFRYEGEGEVVTEVFKHSDEQEMMEWMDEMVAEGDEIVSTHWEWVEVEEELSDEDDPNVTDDGKLILK